MDPSDISQNEGKQTNKPGEAAKLGWSGKRKGFLFWIQVEMSRRQWETQALNSEESSGQNKERIWESSEYKKTLMSWVQRRLPEQVIE